MLGFILMMMMSLYTACELFLMVLGIYRVEGLNPLRFMIPAIAMALSSGIYEELLFRGVLFGSVEQWLGGWAALVVSSLVFGLSHLIWRSRPWPPRNKVKHAATDEELGL